MISGPAIEQARLYVDSHGAVDLEPTDPLAPRVVVALVNSGRVSEAVSLAMSLRTVDLSVSDDPIADANQLADVVLARIWVSWVEQAVDDAAMKAGRRLLALGGSVPLDPHRRVMVNYAIASALMSGSQGGDDHVMADALTFLTAARALAVVLELSEVQYACTARMALLHLPSGDLARATELAMSAMDISGRSQVVSGRGAFISFMTAVSAQWVRHLHGLPMEEDVVASIRSQLTSVSFDRVVTIAARQVLATFCLQQGDIRAARYELYQTLKSSGFDELGVWRLRPLAVDGYLAVVSGDERRARDRAEDLTSAGAAADALLVHATQLLAHGDNGASLEALRPVTTGELPASSTIFTIACVVESLLLEDGGLSDLADQSMRRAIGASEPLGALRLFSLYDLPMTIGIVQRAIAQRPGDSWALEILQFLLRHDLKRMEGLTVRICRSADVVSMSPTGQFLRETPLTGRELEVLKLVDMGASQAQVASELFLSLNTVKTHLRSIRQKLGVVRTSQATAVARGSGWLGESRRGDAPQVSF